MKKYSELLMKLIIKMPAVIITASIAIKASLREFQNFFKSGRG